ncbi:TniQ family protein [Rhizobium leguminosarum]
MTRPADIVPFNIGETVASYCSRVAVACGYENAKTFAAQHGFRFQGLAVGNENDLESFAALLGTSRQSLFRGVVITKDRITSLSGVEFSYSMAHRRRLRFCPACVLQDERQASGRRGHRAYGRIEWLAGPIRVCREHGVMLVELKPHPSPDLAHDFASKLAFEQEIIPSLAETAFRMEPDSLQGYVEGRIRSGPNGNSWLDAFPMYVVVRLCETVGAVARYGIRVRHSEVSDEGWSECAGTGFDILCGGETEFKKFLVGLLERFYETASDMGGPSLFGPIYRMLADKSAGDAFQPIREIMREVVLNEIPLGPGNEFFGPVTERRVHSVYTASRDFRIQPARLRSVLIRSGIVDEAASDRTFNRILVPVETMESIAAEISSALSFKDTALRLGLDRSKLSSLIECGVLRRFETATAAKHGSDVNLTVLATATFRAGDVDDLLRRLDTLPTVEPSSALLPIGPTARKINSKNGDIIRILLDGGLKQVARVKHEVGFASVRLDPNEVRELTKGEDHGCYSFREVELAIPVSNPVLHSLIEGGHIATVQRVNPYKRHMQTVVEPGELERFMRKYISLNSLAGQQRMTTRSLEARFRQHDIEPEFIASGKKFYSWEAVAPAFG